MRIVYNSGSTGLTGTVGYRIVNADGTEYQPRTTVGITESPAGSYGADEPVAKLAGRTAEWDNGIGTVGASESFPASLAYAAPLDAPATQTAAAAAITAYDPATSADLATLIGNGGDKTLPYRVLLDTNGDGVADTPAVGVPGVTCVLTSDAAGNTQVGSAKVTDAQGYATWKGLVAGTYYVWREHPAFSGSNPDTEVVS